MPLHTPICDVGTPLTVVLVGTLVTRPPMTADGSGGKSGLTRRSPGEAR